MSKKPNLKSVTEDDYRVLEKMHELFGKMQNQAKSTFGVPEVVNGDASGEMIKFFDSNGMRDFNYKMIDNLCMEIFRVSLQDLLNDALANSHKLGLKKINIENGLSEKDSLKYFKCIRSKFVSAINIDKFKDNSSDSFGELGLKSNKNDMLDGLKNVIWNFENDDSIMLLYGSFMFYENGTLNKSKISKEDFGMLWLNLELIQKYKKNALLMEQYKNSLKK